MTLMLRRGLAAWLLVCCFLPAAAPAASSPVNDWATYGYEPGRSSYDPNELQLTAASVPKLALQWSADLGAGITSQPIVVHNAVVGGVPTELVYIGAANGVFAAFNAATGAQIWSRQLTITKNGCGQQPNGSFGIAGTPVHDPATHLIYVADGGGLLYALDDATGTTAAGWPIQVIPTPASEFVWGALSLTNGRVVLENASYCDIEPYNGFVFSVDPVARRVANTFAVTTNSGGEGGIWGYGGASVDAATGDLYVATGNGEPAENTGYSENVVRLDPSLNVVAANYAGFVGGDVDYGATPFLYATPCNNQVAAINKSGILVTYNRDNIDAGPLQKLQIAPSDDGSLIGDLAQDLTNGLIFVGNPDPNTSGGTTYPRGLLAFTVNGSCQLQLAWSQGGNAAGGPLASPSVVPGVVFFATGSANTVYALDSATGTPLWNSGSTIKSNAYVAPSLIGGQVFIGSWDSHLYVFGVPATPIAASLLPGGRTVGPGTTPSVFATMLNAGGTTLTNCHVALPASAPSGLALTYQTTNPATNQPTGTPNTPVSIAAGQGQSFVLSFAVPSSLTDLAQGVVFACDNVTNAASIEGVDTLDLTVSASPVADIVALAATAAGNGVLHVPAGGAGAFAAASINVGATATLTVSADLGGAALPLAVFLCETNPSTAQCLAPPAPSVQVAIDAKATPTFSVFVNASGAVPLAPAASRVFLRFADAAGAPHGSTSVAVTTD